MGAEWKVDIGHLVVDSSGEHLLAEGDNVDAVSQVEVFVHPHLARGAAASLHLVYDELWTGNEGDFRLVG